MQKQELCCQSCFNAMQKAIIIFYLLLSNVKHQRTLISQANSVDSDQTAHWSSDLGLHCVQTAFKISP